VLAQIQKEFPQDVRIVYRHFPLTQVHDKAALAAQASEAAGAQGKFWEMHDLLFERQSDWSQLSVDQFKDWVITQAEGLGLDKNQFAEDLVSQKNVDLAQAAWDHGVQVGLPGTPFLLVNGQIWPNNLPMSEGNISAIIQLDLLEKREFTSCPPMTIDPLKQYVATLHTEKGDISIELYPDKAPIAVNNFIFLAHNGWYDGVTFHRVISGFVAQAGDPSGTGFGGPGYAFVNETSPDLKFDKAGVVAMANAGPDSNGSQFFITFAPAPQLDGNYTIFGKVISGMDVAQSLTPRDPSTTLDLAPGDKILSVSIEEK
jgi:cyclophilin family peptidyl-prolyl cis-trans isomerase